LNLKEVLSEDNNPSLLRKEFDDEEGDGGLDKFGKEGNPCPSTPSRWEATVRVARAPPKKDADAAAAEGGIKKLFVSGVLLYGIAGVEGREEDREEEV
jgi:hypothetical protein